MNMHMGLMIDRHRFIIAKKAYVCWECQGIIEKTTVCVCGKVSFYHDVCYFKLRILLRRVYGLPQTTMSSSAKLSNKWLFENFPKEEML